MARMSGQAGAGGDRQGGAGGVGEEARAADVRGGIGEERRGRPTLGQAAAQQPGGVSVFGVERMERMDS